MNHPFHQHLSQNFDILLGALILVPCFSILSSCGFLFGILNKDVPYFRPETVETPPPPWPWVLNVSGEGKYLVIDWPFFPFNQETTYFLFVAYLQQNEKHFVHAGIWFNFCLSCGAIIIIIIIYYYLFAFRGSTVKARVWRFLTDVQHCYGTIQEPRADWRQSKFSISFTFLFSNPTGKRRNPNRQG